MARFLLMRHAQIEIGVHAEGGKAPDDRHYLFPLLSQRPWIWGEDGLHACGIS